MGSCCVKSVEDLPPIESTAVLPSTILDAGVEEEETRDDKFSQSIDSLTMYPTKSSAEGNSNGVDNEKIAPRHNRVALPRTGIWKEASECRENQQHDENNMVRSRKSVASLNGLP